MSSRGCCFAILFLSVFARFWVGYPATFSEVKESYTAYSILTIGKDTNNHVPGLLFQADNNYLSPLGVYARIPTIALFGLTPLGTRLPTIIFGISGIVIFYLLALTFFKQKQKALGATMLFALAPFLIQVAIYDLAITASVTFLLLALYGVIKSRRWLLVISLLLALLASIQTIFIVVGLLIYYFHKKSLIVLTGLIFIMTVVCFAAVRSNPQLGPYLVRSTVMHDLLPATLQPDLDIRLSFDTYYPTIINTKKFNFHRLALNKQYVLANAIAKAIIRPFDYETLTSSLQSQTLIAKDAWKTATLPKFYFWELPLLVTGFFLLFRQRQPQLLLLLGMTVVTAIFFKGNSLVFIVPIAVIAEFTALWHLLTLHKIWSRLLLSVIAVLLFFSTTSLFGLIWYHKDQWFPEQDYLQYQIWSTLSNSDLNLPIHVTDRLGEPAYYYLYYKQVDPRYFQMAKSLGPITDQGTQRIDRIGAVTFGAFSYSAQSHPKNEIFIGLVGEFVGWKNDYQTVTQTKDFIVTHKVPGVRLQDRTIQTKEIWFTKSITE